MLSNRATFKAFLFDEKRFRKDLKDALYQLFIDACQAWVDAVLHSVEGSFPVWTGMSKASLVPLGEYLQVESLKPFSLDLDIDPHPDSGYDQLRGKTIAAGLSANVFKISQLGAKDYPTGFNFNFTTLVPHYEINESSVVPWVKTSPWYTFEAGSRAFEQFIDDNHFAYVPGLAKYLKLGGR